MARSLFHRSKLTRSAYLGKQRWSCFLRSNRRNGPCIDTSCFRATRALDLTTGTVIHRGG